MDYYLRYGSYALVAGDSDLLDERVLTGLRGNLQFPRGSHRSYGDRHSDHEGNCQSKGSRIGH